MCQYHWRCPVGEHHPTTRCRYVGSGAVYRSGGGTPGRLASVGDRGVGGGAGRVVRSAGSSDRTPQLWAGVSGLDLLIFLLLVGKWLDFDLPGRFAVACLAVAPFVIGTDLLSKCRAWLSNGTRRCEQPRRGLLVRCADHRSQALTSYDLAGGLSLLIGCVNVMLLIASVVHRY